MSNEKFFESKERFFLFPPIFLARSTKETPPLSLSPSKRARARKKVKKKGKNGTEFAPWKFDRRSLKNSPFVSRYYVFRFNVVRGICAPVAQKTRFIFIPSSRRWGVCYVTRLQLCTRPPGWIFTTVGHANPTTPPLCPRPFSVYVSAYERSLFLRRVKVLSTRLTSTGLDSSRVESS